MHKIQILKISLFVVFIGLAFIAISRQFETRVDAQIAGYGENCIENGVDCSTFGASYELLSEKLLGADINGNDFSRGELSQAIENAYGENDVARLSDVTRTLCIDTNIISNDIIPYYYGTGSSVELNIKPVQNVQLGARICHPGYIAQDATVGEAFRPGNYNSWGCCKAGYQFVTITDFSGANPASVQNNSACCLIPSGVQEGDPNYPNSLYIGGSRATSDCLGINGDPVWDRNTSDENGDGTAEPTVLFSQSSASSNDPKILGKPLARNILIAGGGTQQGTYQGAASKCADTNGCVIVNETSARAALLDRIRTGNSTYSVTLAEELEEDANRDLTCNRCFSPNEAMFVEDPNDFNGNRASLITCDPNGSQSDGLYVKRTALINNSVADTLAVLRAGDPENAQFIQQCRSSGGIPTAIGCIDPTPIGIITGLIRLALGIVGGVALIQLIIVGIQYQRGDEAKIKEARDKLIATLTGVAVLIFSVLILRILGVNILDVLPAGSV